MVKKMVVQVVKVTINRDSSDAMKGTEWAAIHVYYTIG
jgi:hypothetical protein